MPGVACTTPTSQWGNNYLFQPFHWISQDKVSSIVYRLSPRCVWQECKYSKCAAGQGVMNVSPTAAIEPVDDTDGAKWSRSASILSRVERQAIVSPKALQNSSDLAQTGRGTSPIGGGGQHGTSLNSHPQLQCRRAHSAIVARDFASVIVSKL